MKVQINIPIYRALKLGTKDEYVEGYYLERYDNEIICTKCNSNKIKKLPAEYIELDDEYICLNCFPDFKKEEEDKWTSYAIYEDGVELVNQKYKTHYIVSEEGYIKIDPLTLAISFDSGKTWDTIDKAAEHVAFENNRNPTMEQLKREIAMHIRHLASMKLDLKMIKLMK